MFSNYLKIAWRNLLNNKTYASINIVGLALGLSTCIILMLFVEYELNYDKHNVNYDRILRIDTKMSFGGDESVAALSPDSIGPILISEFNEVIATTTFSAMSETLVEYDGVKTYEDGIAEAQRQIFDIFSFDIVQGSIDELQRTAQSVAISSGFAERLFTNSEVKNNNPIGQTLIINDELYSIGIVFADLPGNAHQQFDALIFKEAPDAASSASPSGARRVIIRNSNYILLANPLTPLEIDRMAQEYNETYMAGFPMSIQFTSLTDIHLYDQATGGPPVGSIYFVLAMAAAGFFILGIAAINYVNLALAASMKRTREVGMRKVVGAGKGQLMMQFLGESLVVTLVAFVVAIGMTQAAMILLPIDQWLSAELSLGSFLNLRLAAIWFISLIALSILTGLYPAFYLASINPVSALKAKVKSGTLARYASQGFLVIQFAISITALCCALLMTTQYMFMTSRDMGFRPENIIAVPIRSSQLAQQLDPLRLALENQDGIESVGIGFRPPGIPSVQVGGRAEDDKGIMQDIIFSYNLIGSGYLQTIDTPLLIGDYFDSAATSQSNMPLLVNQAFARRLNLENPLGVQVNMAGRNGTVVGLVQDFHFDSAQLEIEPLVIAPMSNMSSMLQQQPVKAYLVVRAIEGRLDQALQSLSATWPEFDLENPLSFELLEDRLAESYQSEQNQIFLVSSLAVLCILISSMGLFGLVSINIEQRRKEITMRKILGSSIQGIVMLLFRNILLLVAFAALIAVPASWYVFQLWLQSFSFQAAVNPLLIGLSIIVTGIIALLTVSGQCLRIARTNPADNLKYE